jgi:hypothetical protein
MHAMKRPLVVSVLAALMLAAVPSALARTETTTPGVVYTIKVILTNTSISIAKDRFTRDGVTYYPRGAVIHFAIVNQGTRSYALKMWDETTVPIKPKGQGSMLINWNYRGVFFYSTQFQGRAAGPKGHIVIY